MSKPVSWKPCAASVLLLGGLAACAVTGVGYDGPVGYAGGYYEPYDYDYGGWSGWGGGHYRVGPPGGGGRPDGRGGTGRALGDVHPGGGGGRGAPSIPSHGRGR